MSRDIYTTVLDDLKNRKAWEGRQGTWYEMRHDGLRRRNKPHANAADLHFPMIDGVVDKLKPFYFSQIWGSEQLATFVASRLTQQKEATDAAAAWFHFQIVQYTNFFREGLSAIDNMLMSGNEVVKLFWNSHAKELVFDAIDPIYIVVPQSGVDLQKLPRLTQILQLTVADYKARTDYRQDEELIKKISGAGPDNPAKEEDKYSREGLTHGQNDDQIIIHEHWKKEPSGKWRVYTYSPLCPDEQIKQDFLCTYEFNGKPFLPFVDFPMEIKDKGYYASRGVAERLGQFENYITRVWNEKADSMSYTNRPLFTHEGETINLNNVALVPGAVIGRNLKAVKFPEPPLSFDSEMVNTRMVGEYLIAMPDFGVGQQINTSQRKTATEVQQSGQLMGMSTDLRARIFRDRLSELYRYAWALLRTYKKDDLQYYFADQLNKLPPEALHDAYLISPDGSPDSWNKPARMQRAQARFAMFKGHPNINQAKLAKSTLREDDPALVRELFVDDGWEEANQTEDQAMELTILEKGFPAMVLPGDNDEIHINTVVGRLEMVLTTGEPLSPIAWQRMQQHLQQHLQALQGKNPKAAKQAAVKVQRAEQAMAQYFPPPMAETQAGATGGAM